LNNICNYTKQPEQEPEQLHSLYATVSTSVDNFI